MLNKLRENFTNMTVYARPLFPEWGVPLVVTQVGMPQLNVDVTSESEFLVFYRAYIFRPLSQLMCDLYRRPTAVISENIAAKKGRHTEPPSELYSTANSRQMIVSRIIREITGYRPKRDPSKQQQTAGQPPPRPRAPIVADGNG